MSCSYSPFAPRPSHTYSEFPTPFHILPYLPCKREDYHPRKANGLVWVLSYKVKTHVYHHYSLISTLLISPFNPSVQSKNKKGESGSPCLIPREGCIKPHGSPITRTEYETIFTHPIIKFIHLSLNPNFLMSYSRKFQSTRS